MKTYDIENFEMMIKIGGRPVKGVYSGKCAKGIVGDYPHGKGVFTLANGVTYDGYWLNGAMTEGRYTNQEGWCFSGAFEQSQWQKGRIDFPNGDYIVGYFDNDRLFYQEVLQHFNDAKTYIFAKNIQYSADKTWLTFDGELVQQKDNNLNNTVEKGWFKKQCVQGDVGTRFTFWKDTEYCELQNGSVQITTPDGFFEGRKITQFYLDEVAKQKQTVSVSTIDWGDFYEYAKANGEITKFVYDAKFKGRFVANNGDTYEGYFFPSNSNCPVRLCSGKLNIAVGEGTFEGELTDCLVPANLPMLVKDATYSYGKLRTSLREASEKSTQNYKQKYYFGTLKDKAHNTVYRGKFGYQGITLNPCAGALFECGLQFYEGDIAIQHKNENVRLNIKNGKFRDEKIEQMVQENKPFALKDASGTFESEDTRQQGEFFVDLKRNNAVNYQFKSGKVDIKLDSEREFHGVTCGCLSKETNGFDARVSAVFGPQIMYNGSFVWIHENGQMEKSGLFDKDFNLIEGKLLAYVHEAKNVVRVINVDLRLDNQKDSKQYLDGTVELIIENSENEKVLHTTESGKFDTEFVLRQGNFSKTTPHREVRLTTENGLEYSGRVYDQNYNTCAMFEGDFVRYDTAGKGKFKFVKGDCRLEYENGIYQAQYDYNGIFAFEGKKYAGMMYKKGNQKYLYATNDVKSVQKILDKKFEKDSPIKNEKIGNEQDRPM